MFGNNDNITCYYHNDDNNNNSKMKIIYIFHRCTVEIVSQTFIFLLLNILSAAWEITVSEAGQKHMQTQCDRSGGTG